MMGYYYPSGYVGLTTDPRLALIPMQGGRPLSQTQRIGAKKVSFSIFWEVYPKKTEKLYALKCYQKAISLGFSHEEIIEGAKNYAAHCKAEHTERQYIKNPSTFLNKGCWADEYDIPVADTCSPEESRYKARVASYNATGMWRDEWGKKPQDNLIEFRRQA